MTKTKPSGKDYLEASLENVIDRANLCSNESEIPFVSAVLSAKANRDQRKAAKQTLFTAIASAIVAVLSLISSVVIYRAQAQQEGPLKAELVALTANYEALKEKLHVSEIGQTRLAEQITALKQSQEVTTKLLQTAVGVVPEHTHSKVVAKPPAEKSD